MITLKAARVNAGLTQSEAAQKLGVSDRTLMLWEMGKTFPNVPAIEKIQSLYGVPYSDLIFFFYVFNKTENDGRG